MPRNPETPRAARHKFTLLKNELASLGTSITEEDFDRFIPGNLNSQAKSLAMNHLLASIRPGGVTKSLIGKMVALGLPKPDWIPASEWEAKFPLLASEKLICHLAAMGLSESEIAKEGDLSPSEVKTLLSFDRVQKRVDELRGKDFQNDTKKMLARINEYLPKAIETAYEIMTDTEQKGSTRLAAAESFIDRVLGKAAQVVKVEETSIKDVLIRIEQMAHEEKEKLSSQKTIELKKEESCGTEIDPIEKWVSSNPL